MNTLQALPEPAPADLPPAAAGPTRRAAFSWESVLLPGGTAVAFLILWDLAVRLSGSTLFPKPWDVALGLVELGQKGLLLKYVVASLFRVTWGFTLAVLVGVPLGLALGWFRRAHDAFNPLIQAFRPISPIAWIPVAILWFGVTDAAPIFLIFLASVFPITVSSMAAVKGISPVYLRAGQNFGLTRAQLFHRVIYPQHSRRSRRPADRSRRRGWSSAAEMIAVSSGLGYLIIDARNAGKRYDLVVPAWC
jgi:NitT/TauT family transport system permease protein